LGLGTRDQAVPFQVSIKVRYRVLVFDGNDTPTAVQALAEMHETPSSLPTGSLLGLGTIDHAVPFQVSARVFGPPLAA